MSAHSDRLTGAQAARLAGVTTDTIRKWHRLGKLAHVGRQPGKCGRWLYRRVDVEALLEVKPRDDEATAIVRAQLTQFFAKRAARARKGA